MRAKEKSGRNNQNKTEKPQREQTRGQEREKKTRKGPTSIRQEPSNAGKEN